MLASNSSMNRVIFEHNYNYDDCDHSDDNDEEHGRYYDNCDDETDDNGKEFDDHDCSSDADNNEEDHDTDDDDKATN